MSAYDLVLKAKERLNISADNQLAELLGVSRGRISHWKSGRNNPDGIEMLKLAECANMSAHDALNLVSPPPQNLSSAGVKHAYRLYIMLNRIIMKIKAKLYRFSLQSTFQPVSVYLF